MFNNAGVQLISAVEDLRFDDWQRQIDLNITGVMNVIGAFVPQLIDSAAEGRPADLINDIDVLTAADVAETVAFIASVPRHVNLTEITILPTQQAV